MVARELYAEVEALIRGGDFTACSVRIAEAFRAVPSSPFHIATEQDFTNDTVAIVRHFNEFVVEELRDANPAVIYTETNGFRINPDEWYFDWFAFKSSEGCGEPGSDGLCDWRSFDFGMFDWDSCSIGSITLVGMERLQSVYASDAYRNVAYREACSVASLHVLTRFQALIQRVAQRLDNLACPLVATCHDEEIFYEFQPAASSAVPNDQPHRSP
jgi:hypothetical protein